MLKDPFVSDNDNGTSCDRLPSPGRLRGKFMLREDAFTFAVAINLLTRRNTSKDGGVVLAAV
jgi:hypothetical protein